MNGAIGFFAVIIVLIIILAILASCIKIVPQAQALVVERLGAYLGTWSVGVHIKMPILDRVAKRMNLKEQVADFPPQPVITKDNVTMRIDTVVFFQITDPKLYAYGVENPLMAIENLTATTLRNIIGDLELDQTLTSRETINAKMRESLDIATDPWGIKVNRVELKNIMPPAAIQDAMEKQMKAERERRESILRAEGEKKSTILVAEGKKQSVILDAEADKQSAILRAEAEKEKRITAYHESGHAILFHLLPDVGPVHTISIIPTGSGAAGYTMPLPEKDEMFNTKGRMLQNIMVSLGGRIAEELIFDDITTGASQDIKQATAIARSMVVKYGMSEKVGMINYENEDEEVFIGRDIGHAKNYGEGVASVIDSEVKRIIDECYAKAKAMIEEHIDVLHKCSDLLIQKEKIGQEEFEQLFE